MQFAWLKSSYPIEPFGSSPINRPILARHYQRVFVRESQVIRTRVSNAVSCDREGVVARWQTQRAASVGVAANGSSTVLVTVAPDGALLDRRHIDLIDRGLPTHPRHHEGPWAWAVI
jgi:hypothetical protein